jgi:hypothetical protein
MNSDHVGGWTKTPNEILEAMPGMSEAELKLTAVLVRLTYGYHAEEVKLRYEDMRDAARLSQGGVANAVEAVTRRGFFRRGNKSMWYVNSLPSRLNHEEEIVQPVDQNSLPSRLSYIDNSLPSRLPSIDKEKESKKRIKKEKDAPAIPNAFWVIPPKINTPEFVTVWADWLRYVDEGGLTFTETQAVRALGKLADAGPITAVASVNRSIDRGWKNIHVEDTAVSNPNGQHPPDTGDDDTMRRLKARLAERQAAVK